ncbi:YciI family protein [Maritalea porphyrae]|uniref:YciI family protein n=1 Tax=Maritalea porphyrae TaxID=880732 RepID=UPI0022AFC087|nr:YciI family protein [Maritalea porphyrae]MCZ4271064.1 YciI family protein [Maritalea porphyrae]
MNNFVVDLEYLVPLEQIEPYMDGHMDYIVRGRDLGLFVSWGPKVPRTGGVIIAQSETRAELEAFCNTDPFVVEGVSKMAITEFVARRPITHKQ